MEDIVQGDIIHLSAGDMIPADIRIIEAKDLFVSQSALTGESEAIEKTSKLNNEKHLYYKWIILLLWEAM